MATLLRRLLFHLFLFTASKAQPGFVSVDCGGTGNHADDLGIKWSPDNQFIFGEKANISVPNENYRQYMTLRHFPADTRKYCYKLDVKTRTRYLVRASFLYGNFDGNHVYPRFDISIGATYWSAIVISDANTMVVKESIVLASSPVINVCLSNATTGRPFISTLELRQLNGSLYYTEYESQFLLSLSARINFGAGSNNSIRYPDDPFDRIWESDSLRRANHLVDVAPGTEEASTLMPIYVDTGERPPQKVLQTAVVGQSGSLSYRLNLDGFPGNGWAFSYFAEIEDLSSNVTRKFKLFIEGLPDVSKPTVNVQENAQGKNRLYEAGFPNVSLPFILPFEFVKTNDSSRGPILNAFEIYKYVEINYGSLDAAVMATFASYYSLADWAQEGGDPCLPASWSWVQCNLDPQPKIISINLSGKKLTGNIPSELTKLSGLVELWLDGNSLTGSIPDFSGCIGLEYIHLENNQLTGSLPPSLSELPSLRGLYLQNNKLSGLVPEDLLQKNLSLNYSGNAGLDKEESGSNHDIIIICNTLAASLLLLIIFSCILFAHKRKKCFSEQGDRVNVQPTQKTCSSFNEVAINTAYRFTLSDIENATRNFEKRIGSGGFGIVYYGKMKDDKEIAVKVLTNDSCERKQEFSNEVSLLSRIYHRNLVAFLGYCQEDGKHILVYEFMHNGTLQEHLHGPSAQERGIGWIKRLEIAEDAAKGIEYLHTGCTPMIIHRDLKSSNILLDKDMRAKVSDFGLSKPAAEGYDVSCVVRGSVGYVDPGYYTALQLTEKSDVYSFGVILLEMLSGQEPTSTKKFAYDGQNHDMVKWATHFIKNGAIEAIMDPSLQGINNMDSMWKIVDTALRCTAKGGEERPSMSAVLKDIQGAIAMERGGKTTGPPTPRNAFILSPV